MHRWRAGSDDTGSAALEFLVVGLILLVPIVYLIVTLGIIQRQALGVEAASRHLARIVATSEPEEAGRAMNVVIDAIVDEYGIDGRTVRVRTSCAPSAHGCPSPGAVVSVVVQAEVRLPLVPDLWGLDEMARVPVESTGVQRVSRLRSDP